MVGVVVHIYKWEWMRGSETEHQKQPFCIRGIQKVQACVIYRITMPPSRIIAKQSNFSTFKGTVSRKWRMRGNALVFWLNWQVFSISSWSGIVVLYRLVSLPSVVRSLRKRICYLKQSLYFIFVDLFVTFCLPAADFRSQLMCDHVWSRRPSSWKLTKALYSSKKEYDRN